jgi:hypothetical protein
MSDLKKRALEFWKREKAKDLKKQGIKDKSRLIPSKATVDMVDFILNDITAKIKWMIGDAETRQRGHNKSSSMMARICWQEYQAKINILKKLLAELESEKT